jgi:secreted PhoX family phosphatase
MAAAGTTQLPATAAQESTGHGIEQEGATLTRFATGITGAEMTGLCITDDGQFFFNVQHPDTDGDDEADPGIVGAVTGVDMNQLPKEFPSVQVPEDDDAEVRTAVGDYQRLARGGKSTDDGEELGSVYTPDGEFLVGQTHPDFNGFALG